MRTVVGSLSWTTRKYRCIPCTDRFAAVRPRSADTLIRFTREDLSGPVRCSDCGEEIPS